MSFFDKVYERRQTNSVKWDTMKDVYQIENASETLAMWIADMDFPPPPAVLEALRKRLEHPIFGYATLSSEMKRSVVSWFERRHHWTIDAQTILLQHGVIAAIANVVETVTAVGDAVAISTPVYPPFFQIPQNQQRPLIMCELIEQDGQYRMDFEKLRKAFQQAKLYILCNPHNPAGVVWSKQDLEKLVALALEYDVTILSDEIHADLLIDGHCHTPLLTVARAQEAKIVTCVAPTKTFNIAGIQAAMMVVPNKELFNMLQQNELAHGHVELNTFAAVALEAAYTAGDAWLDELLIYLSNNMDYVIEHLTKIPGIRIQKPKSTYLLWIDYRQTGLTEQEIMQHMLEYRLALDPGTKYGELGNGFLRMNVAAPFSIIQEGVARFQQAFQKIQKGSLVNY